MSFLLSNAKSHHHMCNRMCNGSLSFTFFKDSSPHFIFSIFVDEYLFMIIHVFTLSKGKVS